MKLTQKIKKIVAIAMVGAMVLLSGNILLVHAQSVSDVSVERPGYGLTHTDSGAGVNVRREANANAGIIVSIPHDTRVMIVGEDGDYYKVQYSTDGYYGYMHKDHIYFVKTNHYLKANTNSSSLNMRSAPNTSASVLAKIPKGVYFAYVEGKASDGWYRGVFGNVVGYTSADYTSCLDY